jgi:hypothetical protein
MKMIESFQYGPLRTALTTWDRNACPRWMSAGGHPREANKDTQWPSGAIFCVDPGMIPDFHENSENNSQCLTSFELFNPMS